MDRRDERTSCAFDWILDQHKEKVVDLIARVTRVSVETVAIVEAMRNAKR
jgi:predicted helicase